MKNLLKRNKKNIFNGMFLIILFMITLYYVFHGSGDSLSEVWAKMQMADPVWVVLSVIFIVLFIYGESHIIHYLFGTFGIKTRRFTCFLYSCAGFFFSCITPSASGGQPMQVYYMKRNRIPIPFATVILMIITITYKAVLVAVGVWLMLFDRTFINERLDGIRFVFYLGIILNIICIAAMLILVFNNRLATNICSMVIRVLERLHIMKSDNQRIDRLNDAMEVYRRTAAYLKKHVLVVFKVFVITILQRTAYFFTTYFIYRSFGLKGTGMYTVVMLQAVISLSVDMLPLPGGMGISEALFRVIYLPVFGSNLITAGLVLSRSVSFYTELFVSAVFTMFAHIYIGRFTKKEIVGVDDFNIDYR